MRTAFDYARNHRARVIEGGGKGATGDGICKRLWIGQTVDVDGGAVGRCRDVCAGFWRDKTPWGFLGRAERRRDGV